MSKKPLKRECYLARGKTAVSTYQTVDKRQFDANWDAVFNKSSETPEKLLDESIISEDTKLLLTADHVYMALPDVQRVVTEAFEVGYTQGSKYESNQTCEASDEERS